MRAYQWQFDAAGIAEQGPGGPLLNPLPSGQVQPLFNAGGLTHQKFTAGALCNEVMDRQEGVVISTIDQGGGNITFNVNGDPAGSAEPVVPVLNAFE